MQYRSEGRLVIRRMRTKAAGMCKICCGGSERASGSCGAKAKIYVCRSGKMAEEMHEMFVGIWIEKTGKCER